MSGFLHKSSCPIMIRKKLWLVLQEESWKSKPRFKRGGGENFWEREKKGINFCHAAHDFLKPFCVCLLLSLLSLLSFSALSGLKYGLKTTRKKERRKRFVFLSYYDNSLPSFFFSFFKAKRKKPLSYREKKHEKTFFRFFMGFPAQISCFLCEKATFSTRKSIKIVTIRHGVMQQCLS